MTTFFPITAAVKNFWLRESGHGCDEDTVRLVREISIPLRSLGRDEIVGRVRELRSAVNNGANPTDLAILVPAFALAIEATRRAIGIELYDIQIMAGAVLTRPCIAEMQTGEGKTYAVICPAFVYALSGNGVHVMTVNEYLAERDFELLQPVFEYLGMTAGLLRSKDSTADKHAAYCCDVTYGPGYEFGFDYLRDQAALFQQTTPRLGDGFRNLLRGCEDNPIEKRQRGHAVGILDEADSVLIDEATTPLVLSGDAARPASNPQVYTQASSVAAVLTADSDYLLDDAKRSLHLTDDGKERLRQMSDHIPGQGLRRPWQMYVEQAVRAKLLFRRDVDYVVDDDKVQIVDQNTGRIFADRSWREGLQQAVEAEAGVTITEENEPVARITRQRFFNLYDRVCGMTGTARGSERELREVYNLDAVVIPPRRPCQRLALPTRFLADEEAKYSAIVQEIVPVHKSGRPILVGTSTIEESELIANRLIAAGIAFRLLNGKQDAEEADIVARAGERGAITISTNMAGRGTDIKITKQVADLGGLHVIATQPQESARIDRQLFGRAARQGDPGSCRLYASAEDKIIKQHAPSLARKMKRPDNDEATSDLGEELQRLQKRIERTRYSQRRQMFNHDDWLEKALSKLA